VKYFSGTGAYTSTFEARPEWIKGGQHVWIDLGDVQHTAEVAVNGKPLGILWHAPYRVDVTSALKSGTNQIAVKVTNTWVNRLIGDQQPNATKITFTTSNPYKAKSKLIPSGLLGPVKLYAE
jgi:beta-galactosidase/beta-glucuronidase